MNRQSLFLGLILCACGPSGGAGFDDGSASTGAEDSESSGTDTTGGSEAAEIPECGVEPSCPILWSPSSCADVDSCDWTEYEPAHDCGLSLLAGGQRGLLEYSDGCEGACYGDYVLLRGDGSAVRQSYWDDFDERILAQPQECALKDAAYFAACQAAYNDDCLFVENWFTACADVDSFACTAEG